MSSEVSGAQAAAQDLEAGIAARDTFLACAAHDLRNPMTPILAQVQRLSRMLGGDDIDRETVRKGVQRLEAVVQLYIMQATTLLDVANLTSGHYPLRPALCNVVSVINGALELHQHMARLAQFQIRVEAPDELMAVTDSAALAQIMNGLILATVSHRARGELRIALESDDRQFRLALSGTGVCMPDDLLVRLQQPFESAFSAPARAEPNASLWVAGQLIDAMSGSVTVDSASSGAILRVGFPRFPS